MKSTTLQNNPLQSRYELIADGQVVGIAEYSVQDNAIRLLHTEVLPGNEGKGYGSQLARQLLDELAHQKKQVVPLCEFMAGYIQKHPEYATLLTSE
ncbi:MAG: N-acetyltransferase [Burkholderiales bacterium]|nr:N-acetyltransferase [Burkholderiales bacterium]